MLNNLFMQIGAEWDGFTVHTRSFHDAGDSIVVEVRYTGTFKPTGRSMNAQACHVWDMKDGRATSWEEPDSLSASPCAR